MGKARSLPWSGAPERVGSGLTCKNKTRLERLAGNKRFTILQKSVYYGRKNFREQALGYALRLNSKE
jgi:hypothetical protein